MHCTACNDNLSDFESTRKDTEGLPIDLCNTCYAFIEDDVDSSVRSDLMTDGDTRIGYLEDEDLTDLLNYLDVEVIDRKSSEV